MTDTDGVVSGYEVSKGQFLVISNEEKLSVAANRSPLVTISKFVPASSVNLMDAVRLGSDKSYWLPPQNEHVLHPYAVLARGMQEARVIGVAKATIWSREWPVCIEVIDGMLALTQLQPFSAIRSGGLDLPEVSSAEVAMATTVIGEFTGPIEQDDLVSDADDALKDLIAAKLAGHEYVAEQVAAPEATMNIMDALKASMPSKKKAAPKRSKVTA
jgi:DNA end-binding protein Ku